MLRKFFLAAAFAALLAVPAGAQSGFGIVGGLVSANIRQDEELDQHPRTGFALGLSMATVIATRLEFAPEALYVQKGLKYGGSDNSLVFKLSYIEVPLLVRRAFSDGNVRPFLTAGPVLSVKVDCRTTATNLGESETEPCNEEGGELEDLDVGLMFGGGVEFRRVSLSIRYNLGLTTLNERDAKNRALMLLAGVSF